MSIRDDFFAAQAKASLWDVAVSIKRGNPLPLDANSVFKAYGTVGGEDYAGSLLEYATSNPVAYPGQICAVVAADATTIYYLDQNLAIKPVGVIPTGDDKTIDVTDGKISLKGAADATAGQQPRIKNVGTAEEPKLELEWYTPDTSTVDGLASTVGGLVTTINGVDGDETKPGLVAEVNALKLADVELAADIKAISDDYVKAADIAEFETKANVKEVADALAAYKTSNDTALAGVKATADAAAVKSEVETALADKADKSVVDAMYTNTKIDELVAGAKTYTDTEVAKKADKAAYEQTVETLNALKSKVEAFLDNTGAATEAIDTLEELLTYIETHDDADITGILASIEALEKKVDTGDKTVSAYVTAAIEALKIGDYAKAADLSALDTRVGALEAVDNFTQAEFTAFEATNTAAIAKAKTDAIADADAKLADKLDKSAFDTFKGENTAAIATAKSEAIADADGKLANKLDKSAFETFKTENTTAIGTAKSEAIAAAATDATEKSAQALADAKKFVTDSYKTAALTTAEIEAAVAVETARADAAEKKNASDISTLSGTVSGVSERAEKGITDAAEADRKAVAAQTTATDAWNASQTNLSTIGEHAGKISALESFKTSHETEYATLESRVTTAEGKVTALESGKADKATVTTLVGQVAAIEAALNGSDEEDGLISEVRAHGLELVSLDGRVTELEKDVAALEAKEDKDTTYTFADGTEGTFTVTPKDGTTTTIDTGAKAYTDAEIKKVTDVMATDEEVKAIKEALEAADEAEATLRKAADDALDAAIKAETAARTAADEALDARLDTVEAFWAAAEADGTDKDVIDTLKEIQEYIASDESGASAMAASIKKNADAIAAIYTPASGDGEEAVPASGVLVDEITRVDGEIADLKAVDHDAAHAATLKSAQEYADGLANNYATAEQGATADTAVQSVTCEADMGIKATRTGNDIIFSWDEAVTLILCGGGADIPAEE